MQARGQISAFDLVTTEMDQILALQLPSGGGGTCSSHFAFARLNPLWKKMKLATQFSQPFHEQDQRDKRQGACHMAKGRRWVTGGDSDVERN